MGIAYRNFWSLNTDEAVVTGILRNYTPKNVEVFMPINAQMKDVDLILMNMKNKKTISIQVKGSRAYEPGKSGTEKYGSGSAGWFHFKKDVVMKSTADYFIFLVYVLEEIKKTGRRSIVPHTITIPTKDLKSFCKKYKRPGKGDKYNFFLWINPVKKEAFDFRNEKYYFNEYLDKKGFEKLNEVIN
jgi:hypothetical protein